MDFSHFLGLDYFSGKQTVWTFLAGKPGLPWLISDLFGLRFSKYEPHTKHVIFSWGTSCDGYGLIGQKPGGKKIEYSGLPKYSADWHTQKDGPRRFLMAALRVQCAGKYCKRTKFCTSRLHCRLIARHGTASLMPDSINTSECLLASSIKNKWWFDSCQLPEIQLNVKCLPHLVQSRKHPC